MIFPSLCLCPCLCLNIKSKKVFENIIVYLIKFINNKLKQQIIRREQWHHQE